MSRWRQKARLAYKSVSKAVNSRFEVPPSADGRRVAVRNTERPLLDPRTGKHYMNNTIRSSRYTYWSFFPRQLVYQFSKLANCYFLFISILQLIPGLSTTGQFTTIVPLLIFVALSMMKEGYEDLRRHKMDNTENRSHILRADIEHGEAIQWKTVMWEELHVGDIVKVQRNEGVPADVVVLHADGAEKVAYIETRALDGETNLKTKVAPLPIAKKFDTIEPIVQSGAVVQIEDPNLDLYNFSGNVSLGEEILPLTNDEVIYRGSILRNTSSMVGLVIYSGEECKIRKNATRNPRIKAPALQAVVNRIVIFIVFLVVVLSIGLTGAYQIWKPLEDRSFYLQGATVAFFPIVVSFIVMLNTMIPLSLYVNLEIIKVIQIALMMSDVEMYDPDTDIPMEARTSTINEELGQVNYVFSDKTGTLTDNIMNFRRMSVAGTAWLHQQETLTDADVQPKPEVTSSSMQNHKTIDGRTEELLRQITDHPRTPFARSVGLFLLSIALCHACVSEEVDGKITYQSASPDEVALVQAAKEMGYVFLDRRAGTVRLQIPSESGTTTESFQILHVLEFTSKRKRMSAILRLSDGRICLFSKGADSTILELLRQSDLAKAALTKVESKDVARRSIDASLWRRNSRRQSRQVESFAYPNPALAPTESSSTSDPESFETPQEIMDRTMSPREGPNYSFQATNDVGSQQNDAVLSDAAVFETCFQHVHDFATDGLRTLLYGYRFIESEEFETWNRLYLEASTSLEGRREKVEEAAALIEKDLELGGATAIEDKLQDGVPETIEKLRRAHIKIWVLTGDKRETAINVGRSCGLIKPFSTVSILDHELGDLRQQLEACIEERNADTEAHYVSVVDGQTLLTIESNQDLYALLHKLAIIVDAVLCCRASPAQKASLVRSIREKVKGSVTLAIGDGSNDVAMLQESHVGIGIAGREGLQAARTSDYSIARFRFLAKLLLVHGRWNYVRTCKYTLATFWKEMVFYLNQAIYQRYTGYTGTSLYEYWSLSMFNALFTSLAVLLLGILEKDLNSATLLAVPELYEYGQRARGFNLKLYLASSVMAASEAVLIFFIVHGLYGDVVFTFDNGLYAMGNLVYTACIIVINLKLQFWDLHNRTMTCAAALVITFGAWSLWNIVLSRIYEDNVIYNVRDGLLHRWGRNVLWWLTLLVVVFVVWTFETWVELVRRMVLPDDVDAFQELEGKPVWRERFERAAATGQSGSQGLDGKAATTSAKAKALDKSKSGNSSVGGVKAALDAEAKADSAGNGVGTGYGETGIELGNMPPRR